MPTLTNAIRGIGAAALLSISTLPAAYATNGYYTHGLGVKNKALAGAGTASPEEAISSASNPASALLVDDKWELGISLFSPRRSYTASQSLANGNGGAFTLDAGTVDSGSEFFPVPYIGKVWKLDQNSALAFNFYGRGGMNTDYRSGSATIDPDGPGPASITSLPGAFGAGDAGVNLAQAFADLTYARQFGTLSLGLSGVFAIQRFKATGLANFAGFTSAFAASGGTAFPTKLTDNGNEFSTGGGVKVGAIWQTTDALSLAASYSSEISMSEFEDYADLFAEGGGFDIPATLRLGASLQASPTVKLHLDAERSYFSDINSVGNRIQNIFGCPTAGAGGTDLQACLGGSNGAGFGWRDVDTIKLGAQWRYSDSLTLRAGFSDAEQPIAGDQILFNVLAPGVVEQHFTLGFTQRLASGSEFNMAFMYAPSNTVSGTNTFDPTQTIALEMDQFEVEFGYRF